MTEGNDENKKRNESKRRIKTVIEELCSCFSLRSRPHFSQVFLFTLPLNKYWCKNSNKRKENENEKRVCAHSFIHI